MKKILLLSAAVAILSISALAQDTKEPNKEMKTSNIEWEKKVIEELILTDAQVAKLDVLNKEYKVKIEALKQSADMSKEGYKEKKMELKKEKEAAFLQFLTDEQQLKYKEMVEKKKKDSQAQPSLKPVQQ